MLTINHDNYDTWLMLYLDNELTATERDAVEAFAKANPAIQEELDGLRETMLQPELPVAMPGKERLLMPELWNEEALTPQQQKLLMLVDNELPALEKAGMEAEIAGNPFLQKEWSLLQKATFARAIPAEMPGKNQLYRQERIRVIPFGRIIRFAAAAAILGFGLFYANTLLNNENNGLGSDQVAIQPAEQGKKSLVKQTDTLTSPRSAQRSQQEASINDYVADAGKHTPSISRQPAITKKTVAEKENTVEKESPAIALNSEPNGTTISREPIDKIVATRVVEVEGLTENATQANINSANIELAVVHQESKLISRDEVVNPDESDDEGTISIGGARIPKQKIRNVYRNITRPITRTLERGGLQLASAK